MVRVYLPATLPALARLHGAGELAVPEGYAATPDPDDEELSYAAYRLAAEASVRLLRADPSAPHRRVVISADMPAERGEGGVVRLAGPVPVSAVAAVHVDGVDAEPEVAAAITGSGDAVDRELEWYDVSELPDLLD
jgi:hypothetical protein